MRSNRLSVWYDGNCPVCLREIAVMRRLDKRGAIDFIDIHEAGQQGCPISPEALLARFHAMEDGKLLCGAAAFAAMWRAIPVLRPFGLLARFRPLLWLLDKLYARFLKIRPKLQRYFAK